MHHPIIGVLLLLLAGALGCDPDTEIGRIPGEDGLPIWATYEVDRDQGIAIYQDDMIFDLVELRAYQSDVRAGLIEDPYDSGYVPQAGSFGGSPWPGADLPYDVASITAFSTAQRTAIESAIDHWNDVTAINLRPRDAGDDTWVEFVMDADADRCASEVGFKNRSGRSQKIWLGANCGRGTVVHEIGHTVGMHHEQSRQDRDLYVYVDQDAIEDGKERNFKRNGEPWGEYDFRSIMHYGLRAFGVDLASGGSAQTIYPLIDLPPGIVGQRSELSSMDIAAAYALARQSEGFVRPRGETAHYDGVSRFPQTTGAYGRMELGDINGDGVPDAFLFREDDVIYAEGTSNGKLSSTNRVVWGLCGVGRSCTLGDLDGDGRSEIVAFDDYSQEVYVVRSDGVAYGAPELWATQAGSPGAEIYTGDLNGDCLDDVVYVKSVPVPVGGESLLVDVTLSAGNGLAASEFWGQIPGLHLVGIEQTRWVAREALVTADVHGSIFVHRPATSGGGFNAPVEYANRFCLGAVCKIADIDGDGWKDLIAERVDRDHFLRRVEVAKSVVDRFDTQSPVYHELDCQAADGCLYADADGDGDADLYEPLTRHDQGVSPGEYVWFIENDLVVSEVAVVTSPLSCDPTLAPPPAASLWEQVGDFTVDDVEDVRGTVYVRASGAAWRLESDGTATRLGSVVDLESTDDQYWYLSPTNRVYADGVYEANATRDIVTGSDITYAVIVSDHPTSADDVWVKDAWVGGSFQAGWTLLYGGRSTYHYAAGGDILLGDDVGCARQPVFALTREGFSTVHLFNFCARSWERIGALADGSGTGIWAGGDRVFVRDTYGRIQVWINTAWSTGVAYSGVWQVAGDEGAMIAVDQRTGALFRLSSDRQRIERYLDAPGQWLVVGDAADEIWATNGQLYAERNGGLHRLIP